MRNTSVGRVRRKFVMRRALKCLHRIDLHTEF